MIGHPRPLAYVKLEFTTYLVFEDYLPGTLAAQHLTFLAMASGLAGRGSRSASPASHISSPSPSSIIIKFSLFYLAAQLSHALVSNELPFRDN
jgi:hypothetical protein